MEQPKFCISVITDFDGQLITTEQYHLTDNQIEGHFKLLMKRLRQGEVKGVTMELSKEKEQVN